MDHKWYVVHTQSGCEFKAKEYLERKIKEKGIEFISEVLVPTYKEDVYKNGKRRQATKKSFPGYILVKMEMTADNLHEVVSTPTVSQFVAQADQLPRPLSNREFQDIAKTEASEDGVVS